MCLHCDVGSNSNFHSPTKKAIADPLHLYIPMCFTLAITFSTFVPAISLPIRSDFVVTLMVLALHVLNCGHFV